METIGFAELLFLAVGLSMDAFAVSTCKGLAMKKITVVKMFIVGAWFGGFQALMPLLGYLLGTSFEKYVNAIAPWLSFILLAFIGGNMIRESFSKEEDENSGELNPKEMFLLAVATSIDAFAVGTVFAFTPLAILPGKAGGLSNTGIGVVTIGITTCLLSAAGVKIGNIFGLKYQKKAQITGGVILILIGLRLLIENFL